MTRMAEGLTLEQQLKNLTHQHGDAAVLNTLGVILEDRIRASGMNSRKAQVYKKAALDLARLGVNIRTA